MEIQIEFMAVFQQLVACCQQYLELDSVFF